ncbi:MAG: hypothetical protein ABIC68_04445 [Candidatus Omnitrophota bacterium]
MEELIQNNINPVKNTNFPQNENKISNGVKCLIFCESDKITKNIILKLDKVNSRERQDYAQDILVEANTLLLCSDYNSKNPECLDCHFISRKYLQEYGHFFNSIG